MKKTIAILLVAIMAVSSVFALDATLSGKFTTGLVSQNRITISTLKLLSQQQQRMKVMFML